MSDLGIIRTVPVRRPNSEYRTREHLTESEIDLLLDTLKSSRHGKRDWLIGLVMFRHGLRATELCNLTRSEQSRASAHLHCQGV